jgi:mono/diheme cytochrome c family protein
MARSVCTLLAVAGALGGCPAEHSSPGAAPTASSVTAADADRGARIYDGNCVPCHQESGVGIPGVYPSLAGSRVLNGDPGELARWVIKGQRPASLPAGRFTTQMPQFGWMKPADAAALFSYLRSHFGNSAPPVDAATVAGALGP